DEDQGVLGELAARVGAVAEGRRDHQQHAVADVLADQALVPAGHDRAGADLEGGGAAVVPGGVELLAVLPLDAGVLGDESLTGLALLAVALDQDLLLEFLGGLGALRDGDRGGLLRRRLHLGQTVLGGRLLTLGLGLVVDGGGGDGVDHPDQDVLLGDAGGRVQVRTDQVGRGALHQGAAADLLALQRVQDLGGQLTARLALSADRDLGGRRAALLSPLRDGLRPGLLAGRGGPGATELLVPAPLHAGPVEPDEVGRLDGRPLARRHRLDHGLLGRLGVLGVGDLWLLAELPLDLGDAVRGVAVLVVVRAARGGEQQGGNGQQRREAPVRVVVHQSNWEWGAGGRCPPLYDL